MTKLRNALEAASIATTGAQLLSRANLQQMGSPVLTHYAPVKRELTESQHQVVIPIPK